MRKLWRFQIKILILKHQQMMGKFTTNLTAMKSLMLKSYKAKANFVRQSWLFYFHIYIIFLDVTHIN